MPGTESMSLRLEAEPSLLLVVDFLLLFRGVEAAGARQDAANDETKFCL